MCGRYTLSVPEGALLEAFDVPALTFEYRPRYNIAPGQPCPVVAEDREGRRIGLLDWGLIPAWKDEPKGSLINARAESVTTKPSFREAFRRRRCLLPADGFFEWKTTGRQKTPYWLHPAEGRLVRFAGLWETWKGAEGRTRHGFAILTTEANEDVSAVHHRMPVVIAPEDADAWLGRASASTLVERLLRPAPRGTFLARRVDARVNRPSEDDPGLLDPVSDA